MVLRREALLWMRQAESDLKKAENDLKTGDWDSAAFWSQQTAEKALKAILINAGKVYRGHDLLGIGESLKLELEIDIDSILKDLRELTIHYTISRYPNAANALPMELYDEEKARGLVEMARRVLKWSKQYLR
ncbi:MAG: HEPN domain-containing protein [Candidatus Bathyarchaeia archaeon]